MDANEFSKILLTIKNGGALESAQLLPYLCAETTAERANVNFRLAEVLNAESRLEQARVFVDRAWLLSGFSSDILSLYIEVHDRLKDYDAIREAYKRIGIKEAAKGSIAEALRYFNLWHYAYASFQKLDRYGYDFDILQAVNSLAQPFQFPSRAIDQVKERKIRIVYLVFGMLHEDSVLVKINRTFARWHDKRRFDVTFVVPDRRASVDASDGARENVRFFEEHGCHVVVAPNVEDRVQFLLAVGRQIQGCEPDILITDAVLAEFEHYFIACLHPAPIIVGLLQGPPAQFAAPDLDACISWSYHPLIDSPCPTSLVSIGLDLPDIASVVTCSRQELGLPEEGLILMSAGRYVKFQDTEFWKAILSVLSSFENAFYVVVGPSLEDIPFIDALLTPETAGRIKSLGWRHDILNVLSAADVILDSYPSGGGQVLVEGMALGIPFVSFKNDYLQKFDQTDWSVAEEFVSIPELIVDRGNFVQFTSAVSKLLRDESYRKAMGRLCKERIAVSMGSPENGVRKVESTLLKVIQNRIEAENRYPLVTIITPTFDRASYLDETIQSVLSQDYPNIEYIVLDDGSTDNTCEVLERYKGLIHWESHPNMGETLTVNKGFVMAKGEIVCVVNSDDPLLPGAVSKAVAFMNDHPSALAAYPDWREIGPASEFITDVILPDYTIENMLREFNVGTGPGTFIRRRAFEVAGYRDPSRRYTGDLEHWFRIALHGELAHIPSVLATHRTHRGAASATGRGPIMAIELATIAKSVLGSPSLPPPVQASRRSILRHAYGVVQSYCGDGGLAWLRLEVAALKRADFQFIGVTFLLVIRNQLRRVKNTLTNGRYIGRIAQFLGGVSLFLKGFLQFLCSAAHLLWVSIRRRTAPSSGASGPHKKFALVSHALPPSWSGQAVAIKRLLEGIESSRYCLISSENYKPTGDFVGQLAGSYYYLPAEWHIQSARDTKVIRWLNSIAAVLIRGIRIGQILIATGCRTVVVATGDLVDLPAANLAAFVTGARLVPYLFDDYVYQWSDSESRKKAKLAESIIYRKASCAIVPNEFLQEEIARRTKIPTTIVRNPSGNDHVPPRYADLLTKDQDSPRTILYTGAIYHINFGAFRNLIKAIDLVENPPIKLHLYTAQSQTWLSDMGVCGEHLVFHPHVPPEEIEEAQKAADILFMAFAFDSATPEVVKTSAPGKLGDYLASGVPILAHVPGDSFLAWYLRKFECGFVVDQNTPEALECGVRALLTDEGLRSAFLCNAQERARVDFSPTLAREVFLRCVEGDK